MRLHLASNKLYGNVGIRFLARCIDTLVLGLFWPLLLAYILQSQNVSLFLVRIGIVLSCALFPFMLASILYTTEFIHRFGGTIGKLLLNLRVRDEESKYVSRKVAFFREFIAKPISAFFFVGYIAILFNKEHRGWHDDLSGTYVTKKGNRTIIGLLILLFLLILHVLLYKNLFSIWNGNASLQQNVHELFTPSSLPPLPTSEDRKPLSQTLSPEGKTWLLALGGFTFAQNNEGFDQLQSPTSNYILKASLIESWDIKNKDDAFKILTWLKVMGHSAQFDLLRKDLVAQTHGSEDEYKRLKPQFVSKLRLESTKASSFILDLVWDHRDDLSSKKLLAWDYGRMIGVARWSYSAGFISEEEAWKNMLFAGQQIQHSYSSWDDYERNYLLGRSFWKHSIANGDIASGLTWLENNPKSPWKTVPWNLPEIDSIATSRVMERIICGDAACTYLAEEPYFDSASQLPDNYFPNIPIYKDAQVFNIGETTGYKVALFSTQETGSQGVSRVLSFYTDFFKANGWKQESGMLSGLSFSKSGISVSVGARLDASGIVRFSIQHSK